MQSAHTNQAILDDLIAKIKLRFWLPIQQSGYEYMDQNGHGINFGFCIGFQCPVSKECKIVRFFSEEIQQGFNQSINFRPYFASEARL